MFIFSIDIYLLRVQRKKKRLRMISSWLTPTTKAKVQARSRPLFTNASAAATPMVMMTRMMLRTTTLVIVITNNLVAAEVFVVVVEVFAVVFRAAVGAAEEGVAEEGVAEEAKRALARRAHTIAVSAPPANFCSMIRQTGM